MPFSQDRLELPLHALIAETKQQPPPPAKRAYRSFPSQPPRRLHPRPISPAEEPPRLQNGAVPDSADNLRIYSTGRALRRLEPRDERSTTLYISNLDYCVTNTDIELLFSEVGELERHSIHYDSSGRSKGTGEVVYKHHSDALAAIERYNNHRLDGKTLEIKLVGHEIVKTVFLPPTTNYLQGQPSHVFQRLGRAEPM